MASGQHILQLLLRAKQWVSHNRSICLSLCHLRSMHRGAAQSSLQAEIVSMGATQYASVANANAPAMAWRGAQISAVFSFAAYGARASAYTALQLLQAAVPCTLAAETHDPSHLFTTGVRRCLVVNHSLSKMSVRPPQADLACLTRLVQAADLQLLLPEKVL